jgi:hypothetical protein
MRLGLRIDAITWQRKHSTSARPWIWAGYGWFGVLVSLRMRVTRSPTLILRKDPSLSCVAGQQPRGKAYTQLNGALLDTWAQDPFTDAKACCLRSCLEQTPAYCT